MIPGPPSPGPAVAVVGCGAWGQNLVRNFHALGALAAVCDLDPASRERAAAAAPGAAVLERPEAALALEAPAVVLATPAETHFRLARQALLAGKDVLVEKPLALDPEEGEALVRLAAEGGRILMVGHVLEYHPAVLKLLELVRSGELGSVYYIYSNRLSMGRVRREENILWSFAPHDIAVILRLVGEPPLQVAAAGGSYLQPRIADVTVTTMLFASGVRAHIHVSWLHPFKEQRLVVVGSHRMVSFDDVGKRLTVYDKRVEIQEGRPRPIEGEGRAIPFDSAEPLRQECRAFLEAVATRRTPRTDGRSGVDVLRVLDAAQRSMAGGGAPVGLERPAGGGQERLAEA